MLSTCTQRLNVSPFFTTLKHSFLRSCLQAGAGPWQYWQLLLLVLKQKHHHLSLTFCHSSAQKLILKFCLCCFIFIDRFKCLP